jgi:hypothetical protein
VDINPVDFPITFNPEWSLELQNSFTMLSEPSIIRNKYITLSTRSVRLNFLDNSHRINCSLFADYKLLEFAQELNLNYYDMCTPRKLQIHPQLRYHFVLRSSELLADNSLMSKTDWLELCYYAVSLPFLDDFCDIKIF